MKISALAFTVIAFAAAANAQTVGQPNPINETLRIEALNQSRGVPDRQANQARQKAMSDAKGGRTPRIVGDPSAPGGLLSPGLTESDKQAIAVDEDIRKKYGDMLKRGKSGLIRLQNADICTPNTLIVTAVGGCPNNVAAKATAFSFRTSDYVPALFSDVVFKGTSLSARGAYTIGIFANLGQADLTALSVKSEGIRQLADFTPPADMAEFERQSAILRRGATVGGHAYLPRAEVNPGDVFVLRSVAYRANLYRGEKPRRINVMAGDERADVTLVFKVERLLSDGSVVLIWRELKKSPPPRVVLEAVTPKPVAPNKFLSTVTQ